MGNYPISDYISAIVFFAVVIGANLCTLEILWLYTVEILREILRRFYGNITENSLVKQKWIDGKIVVGSILTQL